MKSLKMTLTMPVDVIEELKQKAVSEGFLRPQVLARHFILRALKKTTGDEKEYSISFKQWREIEAYAQVKGYGDVESLAGVAIVNLMTRNALTEAQKMQVECLVGISEKERFALVQGAPVDK